MNILTDYEQHVQISKKLKMSNDFYQVREPYKDDFEKIYNKAKEENINTSNAKQFLHTLSKEELNTLQHYTLLVDKINISELDDEGAYNLLLHHYEKFDFNNDGFVSDGIGLTTSILPFDMPSNEKEALVKTINEMPEPNSMMALMMISRPKITMVNINSDGSIKYLRDNNISLTHNTIIERVNNILNPPPQAYASAELKDLMKGFLEEFEKNHELILKEKEQVKYQSSNNVDIIKAKIEQ
jgi:hypothetical protein